VFSGLLPSNGGLTVDCLTSRMCLLKRCLAMYSFVVIRCSGNVITEPLLSNGSQIWLHYSGFQAVLTEPLPSNGYIRHNKHYIDESDDLWWS
jgi:hypothetical protein